jgi:hypothetical protein
MPNRLVVCAIALLLPFVAGCASYRVSSNVQPSATPDAIDVAPIMVTQGPISDREYTTIGPIEVSVKKLTVFHEDPTQEQADQALVDRARAMNADAVINVTYTSGIGFTTWGYIDAKGTAVKFKR